MEERTSTVFTPSKVWIKLQKCNSPNKWSFLMDLDKDQCLKPLGERLKRNFKTEGSDSLPESKDQTL